MSHEEDEPGCAPIDEENVEENDIPADDDVNQKRKFNNPEKSTGVIYLSTIPYRFTKRRILEYFSNFGEVGRIFLQVDKRAKKRTYVEGWVEFKKKKVAKQVAEKMNGVQVGGKHRTPAFHCLWSMKYLSGFKWSNLIEQLTFEKTIEEQRLRVELSQARREAKHFVEQVEKSGKLRSLEKRVTSKGEKWINEKKRDINVKKQEKKSKLNNAEEGELLNMIFG